MNGSEYKHFVEAGLLEVLRYVSRISFGVEKKDND